MNVKLFVCALLLVFVLSCKKDKGVLDFRLEGEWEMHSSPFPIPALVRSVDFQRGDAYYRGLGRAQTLELIEFQKLFFKFVESKGWSELKEFPGQEREGAVSFMLDGKAYVGLGKKDRWQEEFLKDFWVYDFSTDSWDSLQMTFPGEARSEAVAFTRDGKAYVGTGIGDGGAMGYAYYGDFYEFSPQSGWKKAESLSLNPVRSSAAIFQANGYTYLCFGHRTEDIRRDVYRLAEDALSWEAMKPLSPAQFPILSSGYSSFVLNREGRDYAFIYPTKRGEIGNYMYFPREDRWETVENLPGADFYFTVNHTLYHVDGMQTFRLVED